MHRPPQKDIKTIIFASPVSDFTGGAERSMFELIINSRNQGYRPVLIVPRDGEIKKRANKEGIKVYCINFDWWVRGVSKSTPDFNKHKAINGRAVINMAQVINKENPYVCISYTAVFPWLAYACNITGARHLWQVCEMLGDKHLWSARIPATSIASQIDGYSDKVFANSNATKNHLDALMNKVSSLVEVIYPYVDQDSIIQASTQEINPPLGLDGRRIVCLVGNIQPAKGQLEAVMAVSELKKRGHNEVTLLLVGKETDQNYSEQLLKIINKNELHNMVRFIGYTNNPHAYVKRSDIALVCSHREPFGRVTVEAMSIGTPVIGASSDGTKEIIKKDGKYGLLYTPGDYEQLSDKIELLLANNRLRNSLSSRAAKYVSSEFTLIKNQQPFFSYLHTISPLGPKQASPFTDVAFAYDAMDKELKTTVKNIEHRNRLLEQKINDITSSRKYRLLTRVGKIINTIRPN